MSKKKRYTLDELEDAFYGKRSTWKREAYEQELRDQLDKELQKDELKKRLKK